MLSLPLCVMGFCSVTCGREAATSVCGVALRGLPSSPLVHPSLRSRFFFAAGEAGSRAATTAGELQVPDVRCLPEHSACATPSAPLCLLTRRARQRCAAVTCRSLRRQRRTLNVAVVPVHDAVPTWPKTPAVCDNYNTGLAKLAGSSPANRLLDRTLASAWRRNDITNYKIKNSSKQTFGGTLAPASLLHHAERAQRSLPFLFPQVTRAGLSLPLRCSESHHT